MKWFIVGAGRAENVSRIHRAGADFALSVGQVAGQLLAFYLLGEETVALEADIRLVATSAGSLAGRALSPNWVRERTGCSVVAVERGEDVIVELGDRFDVRAGDTLYLSGTKETVAAYHRAIPGTKASPAPPRSSAFVEAVGDAEDPAGNAGTHDS